MSALRCTLSGLRSLLSMSAGLDEARKSQPPGLRWRQASSPGGSHSHRYGVLDLLTPPRAMTDNFREPSEGGRSPWSPSNDEPPNRSTGCASRSRSSARPESGSSWPPTPTAAGSSATCTTACSSTWSRSRSTSSSRAGSLTPIPRRRRRSSTRWGATCSRRWRDAGARAPDLPAAARGGRPRRGARAAAAEPASRPASTSTSTVTTSPPEIAGAVYFCCLEVLERAPARHAGDGHRPRARRERSSSRSSRTATWDRSARAPHDRVEALGGRLTITVGARRGPASSARSRSRDDASRSRPGRGSRP